MEVAGYWGGRRIICWIRKLVLYKGGFVGMLYGLFVVVLLGARMVGWVSR